VEFKKFNEIAELVGIVAIVSSLVFVGLQMQQSHRIALSEHHLQLVANQIAADDAIAEHPDIWVRGNAGKDLEPQEFAIFAGQVRNLADITYYTIEIDRLMGLNDAASVDVMEFALYVYENPGAYEVWLDREEELAGLRALLNPDQTFSQEWTDLVKTAIAHIEEAEKP